MVFLLTTQLTVFSMRPTISRLRPAHFIAQMAATRIVATMMATGTPFSIQTCRVPVVSASTVVVSERYQITVKCYHGSLHK